MGSSSDYLVIDGQQRITTVSLLLLAMANLIKDGKVIPEDDTLYAQITKKYLVDEINPKNRNLGRGCRNLQNRRIVLICIKF